MSFLRLQNIFWFGVCLMAVPFIGRAQKKPSKLKKVLIMQRAQLGDMVLTTPLFHALKEFNQDIYVCVYGNKINKQILNGNDDVDGYIVDTNSVFRNIRIFRKQVFDCVCITTPDFLALASAYLAGIHCIIVPQVVGGYSPHETIPYKIMRRFVIIKTHRKGHPSTREYLRLLQPLGIFTEDITKHLAFSDEASIKVQKLFSKYKNKMLIGIALSAGNKVKEWPTVRFAEVANYVVSKYNATIVIIGGPDDMKYSEEMKNSLSTDVQYIDTTGIFSIDELKAAMASIDLFISVDNGPLNIALAFDIPTVNIIGPAPEWAVQVGEFNRIVVNRGDAEPAIWPMNGREIDFKEARRQAEAITVEMVTREVDELCSVIQDKR